MIEGPYALIYEMGATRFRRRCTDLVGLDSNERDVFAW